MVAKRSSRDQASSCSGRIVTRNIPASARLRESEELRIYLCAWRDGISERDMPDRSARQPREDANRFPSGWRANPIARLPGREGSRLAMTTRVLIVDDHRIMRGG